MTAFQETMEAPRAAIGARTRDALSLGVLGSALLGETPWGINVPLWTAALLAAGALLARRLGVPLRGEGRWLALPILLFSGLLAWRA